METPLTSRLPERPVPESVPLEGRAGEIDMIGPLLRASATADVDGGRHVNRVGRYAGLTANALGLEWARCSELASSCRLHDIGKLGVPNRILLKPTSLTPGERCIVQQHAAIGYRILAGSGSELLDLAATIALTHHERFDGAGYPHGLASEEIPLAGRIAAVADVYDALTSRRVYRDALPAREAIDFMRSAAGSQFDPAVLEAFLHAVGFSARN
ncbi:MAG TPA: HD domain-containing phosphohydrolase [Gaiellaceae bacterium]|nr:HD domain-containing phosphohydrolase [Gaiellaceae bacterium]